MGDRLRLGALRRRPLALAVAVGVVVVVLAVLAFGGDDGPPEVSGTPREAVETVEAFRQALEMRDFAKICEELYTTEAREAAGGDDCQSVLATETAKLRDPEIKIVGLTVTKDGAVVSVQAGVRGQRPVRDTIRLARQKGEFRIASRGAPRVER
jgi:hypothetical protein